MGEDVNDSELNRLVAAKVMDAPMLNVVCSHVGGSRMHICARTVEEVSKILENDPCYSGFHIEYTQERTNLPDYLTPDGMIEVLEKMGKNHAINMFFNDLSAQWEVCFTSRDGRFLVSQDNESYGRDVSLPKAVSLAAINAWLMCENQPRTSPGYIKIDMGGE